MTMAANARLEDSSKVIKSFLELMRAKRGEVNATVTTAEPLTPQQASNIRCIHFFASVCFYIITLILTHDNNGCIYDVFRRRL